MPERKLPANIREFNEIASVIFARLYASFPVVQDIDERDLAKTLGYALEEKLESGRSFNDVLNHTMNWLALEGYVHRFGPSSRFRTVLTTKALSAMNAIGKLDQPLGSQLIDATKQGSSHEGKRQLSEMIGSFFGSAISSAIKSMG